MTRAIREQVLTTGHEAELKWPNDVLLDGAKICGILAEVVPDHPDAVVIGAGVNTRMPRTDLPLPTATSFAGRRASNATKTGSSPTTCAGSTRS